MTEQPDEKLAREIAHRVAGEVWQAVYEDAADRRHTSDERISAIIATALCEMAAATRRECAERHQPLVDEAWKIVKWLEKCAGADEERAKDTRFITLSQACAADAKNFRATAKKVRAALLEQEKGK